LVSAEVGRQLVVNNLVRDRHEVETLQTCPLCSGDSLQKLSIPRSWIGSQIFSRGYGVFGLQRCRKCSLTFVNPRPAPVLLNAFYESEDYVCHSPQAGSTKTAEFLLQCVDRHGPYEGRRFLDFGCGGGFLLQAAHKEGWSACGYDVGRRAQESCSAQSLKVSGDLSDFSSDSFDVVFLNHVFEHIREAHTALSQCHRLLNKNGKLFIVVPNLAGMRARLSLPILSRYFNIDERHRAFPIHLFYYTARTLVQTLEKSGFRVTATETFGLGEFVHLRSSGNNGKRSATTNTTVRKKRVVRQSLKKSFFRAGLGENLLAVAQAL
jgi:2-polyprenyl-3-methyl-5-hydroxy-6-metoxy-1,4-benzoquinol methylase